MPSPLTVIQGDQGYGEHGPPLVMPNRQAQQQYAQPEGHDIPPAVNVKEDAKAYTMELAVPGIKKEFCRVNINADGNLEVAIENKLEHKEENKKEHFLRREFSWNDVIP